MKTYEFAFLAAALLLLAALSGCAESSAAIDSASGQFDGTRFLLTDEPDGVMCVCDVRDALPSDGEIAVLGRIGGIDNPWTEGEASFVISDPSLSFLAEEKHDCGDNCPYCAKKKSEQMNSMAFVQIVDEDGRVIRTDARTLLGLSEEQMVIVRGKASLNRTGHIVVAATGLYVRD